MYKKLPRRIVLYPADVCRITGRNERTSRRLLQKLRLALGKSPVEFITIKEFCEYYGIEQALLDNLLEF